MAPPRYDPTMGFEDQLQFLGSIMQKTKSLGLTMPRDMSSRITKTIPGAAGTFQAGYGAGSYRVPASLKISPSQRYYPTPSQLAVDVHELGHADDRRGTIRNSRPVTESRGVAYEQLVAPVVMRSLGSTVPDSFWREQALHPYLKEFGQKSIDVQKAFLRKKLGAALYDREEARLLQRSIPKARYQVIRFEDGSRARVRVPSEAEERASMKIFQRRAQQRRVPKRVSTPDYKGRN